MYMCVYVCMYVSMCVCGYAKLESALFRLCNSQLNRMKTRLFGQFSSSIRAIREAENRIPSHCILSLGICIFIHMCVCVCVHVCVRTVHCSVCEWVSCKQTPRDKLTNQRLFFLLPDELNLISGTSKSRVSNTSCRVIRRFLHRPTARSNSKASITL